MADGFARIDVEFHHAIETFSRRRDDFAHPIGCELQERLIRNSVEPRSAPAGQIRDHDIRLKVQLGFIEDQPAARSATG